MSNKKNTKVEKPEAKKPVKDSIEKNTYVICVTGFQALGKMFRGGQGKKSEISGKIYKEYIPGWLEKGLIRKK